MSPWCATSPPGHPAARGSSWTSSASMTRRPSSPPRIHRGGSACAPSTPRIRAPWTSWSDHALELGLRGLKLGPNYQDFEPLGPAARRVYAYAQQHGLPILFHQGTSPIRMAPLRYAHPAGHGRDRHPVPGAADHHGPPGTPVAGGHHRGHPQASQCLVGCLGRLLPPVVLLHAPCASPPSGASCPSCCWAPTSPSRHRSRPSRACARSMRPSTGTGLPRVPEDAIEAIIERDALSVLGLTRPRAVRMSADRRPGPAAAPADGPHLRGHAVP